MIDPNDLPIYRYERAILDAIRDHRAVVIEGPTGSGKTTQLPKMLLRSGLTTQMIGVTQPRRIAAVSVAWRIAEEISVGLGREVGYAIRFDDRTSEDTLVKIMTDGILLQEARTDPDFSRYGVIIVDEAHERTLNIDFTLGLLHRALQRRDDLRVVVSSATIRPETFQEYFQGIAGAVPFISIDARPYPVEMRYSPPPSDSPEDVIAAVADEIIKIHTSGEEGAVLAFLSGEGMIKGVRERLILDKRARLIEIMPLYGKLTREEQERPFAPPPEGRRKVVLATNIAETSITVPDVRFVVDTGLAKIPRVQKRTGITVLSEEGVSRASAEQRAGRAGRTAPGVAIRLYSKKDLDSRPMFTDEEILRLDLSEVVLRLINLGVKDVEGFPLPTSPPTGALRAALENLVEMGAIDTERNLTRIGERMMPFPLSPQLSRMVVEAGEQHHDVADEVLMVAAFMSARSPYLYPAGEENEAREAQRNLAHPLGDAMTAVVSLRRYLNAKEPEKFCKHNYLDPHIMAFIVKAYRQLTDIAEGIGMPIKSGGDPTRVVRCLAVGFSQQILRSRGRVLEGPGDMSIAIHPSSSLFGARVQYVVAAELIISSRAFARNVSLMKPEWVAESNPALAERWRITTKKQSKRKEAYAEPVPDALYLGGVPCRIIKKRQGPSVVLDAADASRLSEVGLDQVQARSLRWRTELHATGEGGGDVRIGRAMDLADMLCLLPHMTLPDGPPQRLEHLPLGAFLEIDRNLHTIGRFLDSLLACALGVKGKSAGWVALATNGEEGFWFEVVYDFPDALEISADAVTHLYRELPDDDPLHERLTPVREQLDGRKVEVQTALEAARRVARQRRPS